MEFNLELFRQGRNAVTRNGKVARFVAYERRASGDKLVVLLNNCLNLFKRNGLYLGEENKDGYDLVSMAPEVLYKTVTCYATGNTLTIGHGSSKKEAKEFQKLEESRSDVVKCVIFAHPQGEK